jgi:hypothetical protein
MPRLVKLKSQAGTFHLVAGAGAPRRRILTNLSVDTRVMRDAADRRRAIEASKLGDYSAKDGIVVKVMYWVRITIAASTAEAAFL